MPEPTLVTRIGRVFGLVLAVLTMTLVALVLAAGILAALLLLLRIPQALGAF